MAGPDITDQRDCNVYLIDLGGEAALIDAGFGEAFDKMVANIEEKGVSPSHISTVILTHCHIDHIGGAVKARDRFGSRLIMHEKDAKVVESGDNRLTAAFCFEAAFRAFTIDTKLAGAGGEIHFDGHDCFFLHIPGHTAGSICPYFDANGKRILFGQDIAAPLLADFDCDVEAWRVSMENLLALKADVLCDGHSGIYEPARVVSGYIRHFIKLYGK